MKYILIILLFLCEFASGQNLRKWSSDSTTNTLWGDWFYRAHPTYSWSADALKIADYRLVKDSALFNMYRIPGIDSIYFVRGGIVFAIKDSAGSAGTTYTFQHSLTESGGTVNLVNDEASPGNSEYYGTNPSGTKGYIPLGGIAFIQNGNSFGAGAVLGTNDLNVLDIETNGVTIARFNTDGTFVLGTGPGDVTQRFYVNGNSRFDGVLNISNNFGLSALSGAAMANFGANGPTTSITWALNNNYINSNTTKNYFRIAADVETNSTTTQTINQLLINPTYNNTSGTSTLRGIYYNPTLTATTGTTNIAIETVTGLWIPRAVRTGFGTYSILVHLSDSSIAQVPSTTFAPQSALDDTAAAIRSDIGSPVTQNYEMFYSDNSSTTVGNTTTEATILGTGTGTAQFTGATAGCVLSLKGNGILSTAASAGTPILEFTVSNYTLGMNLTGLTGSLTNVFYDYDFEIIPVAIGTNQDAIVHCRIYVEDGASGKTYSYSTRVSASFTSSGTLSVDVTADWDAADVANTLTSYKNIVQIFRK